MATLQTQPGMRKALEFLKGLGFAYQVGLALIAIAIIVAVAGSIIGGVFYEGLMGILKVLGASEDRHFLPPVNPERQYLGGGHSLSPVIAEEMGAKILGFFGGILFACGICVVALRLVLQLVGLTGKPGAPVQSAGAGQPAAARRLGLVDRLGLVVVGIGTILVLGGTVAVGILQEFLLLEYQGGFLDYCWLIVGIGSLIFMFGGPRRRSVVRFALYGWIRAVIGFLLHTGGHTGAGNYGGYWHSSGGGRGRP